jgi:osmotically-inducible protein OsmY
MDDLAIKKQVSDQLVWDDRLHGSDINVEHQNGIVKLTGTVPNYYAKHAAETTALQVKGVLAVKNELQVKYSGIDLPADDEVKEKIKDLFYWNNDIDYSKLDVLVNNHVVTLMGSVSAIWKVALAENLAHSVKGVAMVINKLAVVPSQDYRDETIAMDIMDALERNSEIKEETLVVNVIDGVVTLEGNVKSWYESQMVHDTALHTKGVKRIQNNLVITAEK